VTRVLLVDDHPVVRRGIRQILIEGLQVVSVGEACDVRTALASIRSEVWDVIVLDITLPGESGLDLLKMVHREKPMLPVLILSMHPASQFARRALAAGASGYLTKESAPTDLVRAIERVRHGHRYVPRSLEEWGSEPGGAAAPHDALSDREYQVLRMLGSGHTVSEIAAALHLSVKTISTYRTRLLEKLQMRSNAELMRYAIENRLVDS
jgi:two-component system, NarL family, invasion response regulator UvrY